MTEMKGSKYTRLSLSPQPNSFYYLAQTQYVTLDCLELAISLLCLLNMAITTPANSSHFAGEMDGPRVGRGDAWQELQQ